ncbi:MAG: type IX secretion system membrane protein PorP/SprF [Prolixibacteraceae bacterium]
MIPFTNKTSLNPSFAGFNENTTVWAGYQHYIINKKEAFNQFSLSYDTYLPAIDGGILFNFNQGLLGDLNTNTVELGFGFSKHYEMKKGTFIPSASMHFQIAGKQWYVHWIDMMLDKRYAPSSPPGADFARFFRLKPHAGFLWDSPFFRAGFSAIFPFGGYLTEEENSKKLNEPVFIMHLSHLSGSRRKGLVSKPFRTRPQLILLYSQNTLISKAEIHFEEVYYTYSVFAQNNFTENLHGIGGSFGWKINHLRISLSAGIGLPVISDESVFFGEASFRLIIPSSHYSEENPWSPKQKLF